MEIKTPVKMTNPLCNWLLNNDYYLNGTQIDLIKNWRNNPEQNPNLSQVQKLSYQSGLSFYDLFSNRIPKRPYDFDKYLSQYLIQHCSQELYNTLLFTDCQFHWVQHEDRLQKLQLKKGLKPYCKNNPQLDKASNQAIAHYIIKYFKLTPKTSTFEQVREKISDAGVWSFVETHVPNVGYDNHNMRLNPNEFNGFSSWGGYLESLVVINGNCSLKTQIITLLKLTILLGMNKPSLINNTTKLPKIDSAIKIILKYIHYDMSSHPLTRLDYNFAMLVCKQVSLYGDVSSDTGCIQGSELLDVDIKGQQAMNKFFKHMNRIRKQTGFEK